MDKLKFVVFRSESGPICARTATTLWDFYGADRRWSSVTMPPAKKPGPAGPPKKLSKPGQSKKTPLPAPKPGEYQRVNIVSSQAEGHVH